MHFPLRRSQWCGGGGREGRDGRRRQARGGRQRSHALVRSACATREDRAGLVRGRDKKKNAGVFRVSFGREVEGGQVFSRPHSPLFSFLRPFRAPTLLTRRPTMRRKRHKQTRRGMRFYRINFGFREPYKVSPRGGREKKIAAAAVPPKIRNTPAHNTHPVSPPTHTATRSCWTATSCTPCARPSEWWRWGKKGVLNSIKRACAQPSHPIPSQKHTQPGPR